jgi:hypothetical protein
LRATQYKSFRPKRAGYSRETLKIEKDFHSILEIYTAKKPLRAGRAGADLPPSPHKNEAQHGSERLLPYASSSMRLNPAQKTCATDYVLVPLILSAKIPMGAEASS